MKFLKGQIVHKWVYTEAVLCGLGVWLFVHATILMYSISLHIVLFMHKLNVLVIILSMLLILITLFSR